MSEWKVTIDQRSAQGGTDRRELSSDHPLLSDAIEDALEQAGLLHAEVGDYQITVVRA